MKQRTGQIHNKQNVLGLEPATFRLGDERSPDWATGVVSARLEK